MAVEIRSTGPGVAAGTLIQSGTLAARPAAGNVNAYYWATDLQILYRDNGVAWQQEFPHYARYLHDIFTPSGCNNTLALAAAGRVFCAPFQVTYTITIDRIGYVVGGVAAGNVRTGIYNDNGDTIAGAALVVESASVAVPGANQKHELPIVATQLPPGLYWLVIQGDDGTNIVARVQNNYAAGGTLTGLRFANFGGYGVFENPQVSALIVQTNPSMLVRVVSSP